MPSNRPTAPEADPRFDPFDESPAARRRLVLLLYGLVGVPFLAYMTLVYGWETRRAHILASTLLIAAGTLWVLLRREPGTRDWLFPCAIAPTVCCGIAATAGGPQGLPYLAILAAPMTWSATLFALPVVATAWLTASVCATAVLLEGTDPHPPLSVAFVAGVYGLIAWVVYGTAQKHRRTRTALAEAVRTAHFASLAKSQFLASMSHEIRTPLAGMLGMLDLVRERAQDADDAEFLDAARTSGRHLMDVVADILDLTRIEARKLHLHDAPFRLRTTLEECVAGQSVEAARKGIYLRLEAAADLPEGVRGDVVRFRQIVTNLVANAVKFTERGGVVVRLDRAQEGGLALSVRDTGIGIPEDKLDAIFEPFAQADGTSGRRFGGTGLGLTITREIVDRMGGRITVESETGHGSTFRLWLPMQDAPAPPLQPAPTPKEAVPVMPLRILVAEDNAINARVTRARLEREGHTVHAVASGTAALAALARDPFDVVLLDLHMPEMDGLETARRIRADEAASHGARHTLLALTATVLAADRAACRDAGMDGFLAKPLDPAAFHAAVARVSTPSLPPAVESAAPAVDLMDAVREMGATPAMIREMAGMFEVEREQALAEIAAALARADAPSVARNAHALVGTLLVLGAQPAARAARDVERIARAGDLGRAPGAVRTLQDELTRFTDALDHALDTLAQGA